MLIYLILFQQQKYKNKAKVVIYKDWIFNIFYKYKAYLTRHKKRKVLLQESKSTSILKAALKPA